MINRSRRVSSSLSVSMMVLTASRRRPRKSRTVRTNDSTLERTEAMLFSSTQPTMAAACFRIVSVSLARPLKVCDTLCTSFSIDRATSVRSACAAARPSRRLCLPLVLIVCCAIAAISKPLMGMHENGSRNRWQGEDSVHRIAFNCLVGHSKNHTSLFVLSNRDCPGLLHFQHSVGSVVAHSSHDDSHRVLSRIARGGAE